MKGLSGLGRGRTADSIVSIAAITSLALGIGAATAIFTLVNSLILRPIPVANPERLVTITTAEATPRGHTEQYRYVTFDAIRRRVEKPLATYRHVSVTARLDVAQGDSGAR
ncbi:MAG TPA: hypothetical protein VI485_32285 [Vicinamibacterales bacterium]|nr:hypothetical protein [Vicinamibacterales bacterium]